MAPDGGTTTGNMATVCVVDDATGCVVPSHGVRIVGPITQRHVARAIAAGMVGRMFDRAVPEPVLTIRKREPEPRLEVRKPKQRLKGLRP